MKSVRKDYLRHAYADDGKQEDNGNNGDDAYASVIR